jgi:hypothetical protein
MGNGEVVDSKLYDEYQTRIATVEAASGEISNGNSQYWWNLWQIYRDQSWKAVSTSFVDWLGGFCVEPFGCSRQSFYTRIKNIKRWQTLGISDDKIMLLLGSKNESAIQSDIDDWFNKEGELKEDVALRIEAGHETPEQFLERTSQLSPGEARSEVQRVVSPDRIFAIPDTAVYDEVSGMLMFNVRWDHERDGVMWLGTVRITGVQIAPESTGQMYLPGKVASFIVKKLGLRL